MGCVLGCLGSSKDPKHPKLANEVLAGNQENGNYEPLQQIVPLKQDSSIEPISPVPEFRDKYEEPLNLSTRKKVTFDLNVKTYEDVSIHEVTNSSLDIDEEKESQPICLPEDNSIKSSRGSYPLNHRYQNCGDIDDEDEEIDCLESDLDDDDDNDNDDDDSYYDDGDDRRVVQEESSESLFSLSIESQTRVSANTADEKEVNSPIPLCFSPNRELKILELNRNARDRSQYVHSVLNPIENLSQWKSVKAGQAPPLKYQKENLNLFQEPQPFSSEQNIKLSPFHSNQKVNLSKPPKQEIAVDASLSNWLVSSERSGSPRSNSPISQEDRPILSSLTDEELKQMLVTSSPRRSPSRSVDEISILGTVGSYWNHTGQLILQGN